MEDGSDSRPGQVDLTTDSNNGEEERAPPCGLRGYQWMRSIALAPLWICMGLDGGMIGPSLPDLTHLLGCDYEHLTRALAAKSVGIMVGSVVGGVLADRFRRHVDLLLALQLILMGVATAGVPWCLTTWEIGLAFLGQGLAHGAISATGNCLLLMTWGQDAQSPLHLLHTGYGLGTMVAPLIVQPFLSDDVIPLTNVTTNTDLPMSPQLPEHVHWNETQLYIPYAISGGISLPAAIVFLMFYCLPYPAFMRVHTQRRTIRQIMSPAECAGGHVMFGTFMFVAIFCMYVSICGKDQAIGIFLFTIAVESKLRFSKHDAAILNTVLFAAYTAGRLVASVVTMWLPIQVVLFAEVIGNIGAVTVMAVWGLESSIYLWISVALFGFFSGPIYPGGLAWMDRYMTVTAVAVAVLDLGVGVGSLVFPWVSGYLYQHYSGVDVVYLSLATTVFLLVILIATQIVLSVRDVISHNIQHNEADHNEDDVNERTPLING